MSNCPTLFHSSLPRICHLLGQFPRFSSGHSYLFQRLYSLFFHASSKQSPFLSLAQSSNGFFSDFSTLGHLFPSARRFLYIETSIPIRRLFSFSQKGHISMTSQMTLKCNNSYPVIFCHPPFFPKPNPLIYKQKRAYTVKVQTLKKERFWRSGRDSNPRYRFCQYVPLAKECFQPLSHRSVLGNVWKGNYTLPKMKSIHK